MRIYLISPNPVWGGAATANMAIAEMLATDHTVIYNDEYNQVSIKNVIYDSYPVHHHKNAKDLFNYIIDKKINLVIWGISMNLPYYMKLTYMLRSNDIKQCVIFHSLSISSNIKGKLMEWLTSRSVHNIDHLVFVSKYTDASWSKYKAIINHSNHQVIYNPINVTKSKIKFDCSRIGFVGRFSMEKQPEIFTQLSEVDHNNKYIAWGEGELLDSLISKYKNVEFKGHSSNKEEIYNSFDLLVMTSTFENCPMVILEAWTYGIPCVVPNVGGIPELVKNEFSGIIYNDYKTETILSAITKVKQNYSFYSKNCSEVVHNFSFEKIKPLWDNIINL